MLLLTGCASIFDAPLPAPERLQSTISFHLVPDSELPRDVGGEAFWRDSDCIIKLKASLYPRCVTHEVRHCMEGHFHHPQVASSESC
jgi:hypothetical protein